MSSILCILGHDWFYARGRSKGFHGEGSRPKCVRRECVTCHKKQEISHFRRMFKGDDGDYYSGHPIWIDRG